MPKTNIFFYFSILLHCVLSQKLKMAENTKKESSLPPYDLNAKWDACIDLTLRRFAYSSLAGAFGGLLFFRSPVTRWASVAFGAGVGIGTAYTECSNIFDGRTPKWTPPRVSTVPPFPSNQDEHE